MKETEWIVIQVKDAGGIGSQVKEGSKDWKSDEEAGRIDSQMRRQEGLAVRWGDRKDWQSDEEAGRIGRQMRRQEGLAVR